MNPAVREDRDHPTRATRRVAKNTAYLALADIANKTMSFFFYMLAARHLGAGKFGILSFGLAFVTMLGVLTDLGLGTVTAREIARNPAVAQQQANVALSIKLVASVLAIILIGALVNLMGYPRTTVRVVYVLSFFVFANAISTYYCSVFQGFERMELVALTRLAQTAMLVTGAVLLARGGAVVERYAFLYAGAGLTSVLVAGTMATSLVKPGLSFVPREWLKLLRPSAPVGLAVMFTMFYYWNGTTLLSRLRGDEAVGNYSAALRLVIGLAFAGFAFSGAVYPLFSRLFARDPARSARALEQSLRYVIMVVLPVAAFGAVFARPLISLLYGGGYAGAAPLLRILGWWGVCASLNSLPPRHRRRPDGPGAWGQSCPQLRADSGHGGGRGGGVDRGGGGDESGRTCSPAPPRAGARSGPVVLGEHVAACDRARGGRHCGHVSVPLEPPSRASHRTGSLRPSAACRGRSRQERLEDPAVPVSRWRCAVMSRSAFRSYREQVSGGSG
jgi:O-antigen/teichoic acid export membrane protein